MNLKRFFNSPIGRFRMVAFFEGLTLLVLFGITMPLKHFYEWKLGSQVLGPIHGVLFILFLFQTITLGIEYKWSWKTIVLAVVACVVPFGTFYLDHKILKPIHEAQTSN